MTRSAWLLLCAATVVFAIGICWACDVWRVELADFLERMRR